MMKNKYNKHFWGKIALGLGVLCIYMTGCKTPSTVHKERLALPDLYENGDTSTTTIATLSLEEFFPDTLLQGYIKKALANNHSFLQTMEHIKMARSQVKIGKGALLPDVALGINGSVQQFGEYTMDGVGNSTTNTPDLIKDKHIPDPYRDFNMGIAFQWEADIWGKLTNKKRAAVYRWMKSVEAMNLARTLLISEVATAYFDLIGLDKERYVLKNAIHTARNAYNLTNELMKEGEVTRLSVDQFRSYRLRLEEMLLANEQKISEKEHVISTLLGILPIDIKRATFEQVAKYNFPAEVGVPAQLLQYRPDVREAELELFASDSDVKAARKAFYPSLIIGGNAGYNAFDLNKWFSSPASLAYNLSAGITAPIFRQNTIKAMWETAKSNQRMALLNYHGVTIKAYAEVLDLILSTERIIQRRELKDEESRIHHRAIYNANELFKVGYASYLEVLSADERFLSCELERIEVNIDACKLHVLLYRALGGGGHIRPMTN